MPKQEQVKHEYAPVPEQPAQMVTMVAPMERVREPQKKCLSKRLMRSSSTSVKIRPKKKKKEEKPAKKRKGFKELFSKRM